MNKLDIEEIVYAICEDAHETGGGFAMHEGLYERVETRITPHLRTDAEERLIAAAKMYSREYDRLNGRPELYIGGMLDAARDLGASS